MVRQEVLLAKFSEVLYSSQPYILHNKRVDSRAYNMWYTVSRLTRHFNPSRAFISCTCKIGDTCDTYLACSVSHSTCKISHAYLACAVLYN